MINYLKINYIWLLLAAKRLSEFRINLPIIALINPKYAAHVCNSDISKYLDSKDGEYDAWICCCGGFVLAIRP